MTELTNCRERSNSLPKYTKRTIPLDKIWAEPYLGEPRNIQSTKEMITRIERGLSVLHLIDTEDGRYLAAGQYAILEAARQAGWKKIECYVYIKTPPVTEDDIKE